MPEKPDKPKSFVKRLKDTIENVNNLTGLIATTVAVISFASGNRLASYIFIVIACASMSVFIWATLTRLPNESAELIISKPFKDKSKISKKLGLVRQALAIIAITILVSVGVGWIILNGYQDYQMAQGYYAPTATPEEQLIILADFKQAGTKTYDTTRRIRASLDAELKKAGILNIRIVELHSAINNLEEARDLGRRHQAVFVIWGWYDDNGITPNFTITRETPKPIVKAEFRETIAEPARDFAMYISQGLPAQMSYFATFTLGQLYYSAKQFDKALESFDVALANLEQNQRIQGIPFPEGTARLYYCRGYIQQVVKSQTDQAIVEYNKAIELDPKYVTAYYNRGIAYFTEGKIEQAISEFTNALQIDPMYVGAYYNRGFAYSEMGNLEQAIADFSQAIVVEPNDPIAYIGRGNFYADKSDWEHALKDYNTAIDLDRKSILAYVGRGNVYASNNNHNQAIDEYTKAIDLDPKLSTAYVGRGNIHVSKGNQEQALSDYSKAIEFNPLYAPAYVGRGNIYIAKNDLGQAIIEFSKAIELNPRDAGAYYNRGIAYMGKGDQKQAVTDYMTYLKLAPNAPDRVEVEQWISELKNK